MIQDGLKKCHTCKNLLEIECFSKNKRFKDGMHIDCKLCDSLKRKEYRKKNIEKCKERRRKYYLANIEKMRQEKRDYGQKHKEEKRKYDIKYRLQHKNKISSYKKKWEEKMKNDPIFKIKRNLRRRVHHVLKGCAKADNTFKLIGCSAQFFKEYIESLWQYGMTWGNYGPTGWHIDHIIPCYKFNLLLEEEQRKCFHYSNQRPLWAWENLSRKRE